MENRNVMKIMEFFIEAERIISANPQILEDELYPNIKKVYREHYRRKRAYNPTNTRYHNYLAVQQGVRDFSHYDDFDCYDDTDELDVVGGEASALCNID